MTLTHKNTATSFSDLFGSVTGVRGGWRRFSRVLSESVTWVRGGSTLLNFFELLYYRRNKDYTYIAQATSVLPCLLSEASEMQPLSHSKSDCVSSREVSLCIPKTSAIVHYGVM